MDRGEEMDVGCARPTGGPVGERIEEEKTREMATVEKEAAAMIHVGKKEPNSAAPGYQNGKFISLKLSDYLGK